jgi:hypothetical protein
MTQTQKELDQVTIALDTAKEHKLEAEVMREAIKIAQTRPTYTLSTIMALALGEWDLI